jgi:hypothetical protein
MTYGIIFGGNSTEARKVFLLQKMALRIIVGIKCRDFMQACF